MIKSKIVKNLTKAFTICLCCVFCMGVLCSTAFIVNATDEPSDDRGTSQIIDLNGYTVTVPSGWTTPTGQPMNNRIFSFIGSIYNPYTSTYVVLDSTFDKLYLGYTWIGSDVIPSLNSFSFGRDDYRWTLENDFSLTIRFLGGDTTNQSLIQWLYDNNATFVSNEPEPEPEPIIGWFDNDSINFFGTPIVQTTPPIVNDYQTIYYYTFWDKPYAILRDVVSSDGESYMPVVFYYDTYYEALYYGMSEAQRDLVASDVYTKGYNEGYLQGKTEGQSSSIGSNLIGSGFTSITNALNQIIVYQSSTGSVVTLWVIISGAVGIALFIWILKLFAGG